MQKVKAKRKIICASGEEVDSYKKYLKTKHWKTMRIKIAKLNNYTCYSCKLVFKKKFHIHHWTYERVGNELVEDLAFMCEECHNVVHGHVRKIKKAQNKPKKIRTPLEIRTRKKDRLKSYLHRRMKKMELEDLVNIARYTLNICTDEEFVKVVKNILNDK